jgi:hypothetical protein
MREKTVPQRDQNEALLKVNKVGICGTVLSINRMVLLELRLIMFLKISFYQNINYTFF